MQIISSLLSLSLASLYVTTSVTSVEAHSAMTVPKAVFQQGAYRNSPSGHIDSVQFRTTAATKDRKVKGVPLAAIAMQTNTTSTNANTTMTLRRFMADHVKLDDPSGTAACGRSRVTADVAKQPLPDAVDFIWFHPGPCEVWCDNHRLLFNDNCKGNNVGKVPVDKTKCSGASFIQGLYLGVHLSNWEVYANCAPLEGGSETDVTKALAPRASGDGANGGNDGNVAPVTTRPSPVPTATSAVPTTPTPSTKPATTAPEVAPEASSKCKVRKD